MRVEKVPNVGPIPKIRPVQKNMVKVLLIKKEKIA